MDARQVQRQFVSVMAKHLPPSGSTLRLLDLDGCSGDLLTKARADVRSFHLPPTSLGSSLIEDDSVDAVVAYDVDLNVFTLQHLLDALRPGGRLIALRSSGSVGESHPRLLSDNGYIRILVEPALDGLGVLMRGEKPHRTDHTIERIRSVARADADALDLEQFRGRYLHLLIKQQPNKPAWQLGPQDKICWSAVAIVRAGSPLLLAFSSLPKAVAFMQPAVLNGRLADINKVGKFSRATAASWSWDALLNPPPESLASARFTAIEIDPTTAEAPDE